MLRWDLYIVMEVGGVRRLNFLFANLTTPIKTARDARYPEEKCRPLKTRDRTNCCTSDLISKLMVIQFSESGSRGGIKMNLIIYRSDRELNSSSAPHPRLTLNNETRLSSNKKSHGRRPKQNRYKTAKSGDVCDSRAVRFSES
jgi:hypothetical protein